MAPEETIKQAVRIVELLLEGKLQFKQIAHLTGTTALRVQRAKDRYIREVKIRTLSKEGKVLLSGSQLTLPFPQRKRQLSAQTKARSSILRSLGKK